MDNLFYYTGLIIWGALALSFCVACLIFLIKKCPVWIRNWFSYIYYIFRIYFFGLQVTDRLIDIMKIYVENRNELSARLTLKMFEKKFEQQNQN